MSAEAGAMRLACLVELALACACAAAGTAWGAGEQTLRSEHSSGRLVAEREATAAGDRFRVGLELTPDPGWHTYWKNAGDSGASPILKWKTSPAVAIGEISWPFPSRLPIGPLMNFGYEHENLLVSPVTVDRTASGSLRLELSAEWLVCQEDCVPAGGRFSLTIPVAARPRDSRVWAALWARHEPSFPRPARGWGFEAIRDASAFRLIARPPAGAPAPRSVEFFPEEPLILENAAPQRLTLEGGQWSLELEPTVEESRLTRSLKGTFVLDRRDAFEVDAPVRAGPGGPWAALGLAFLGGLLLNLMPCVLPVLSIKILGFARHSGGTARAHGLAYSSGVLVCFWLLAGLLLILRAQGERIGWGFQLQSPAIVLALAALFVVLGACLMGLLEIGVGLTRLGGLAAGLGGLRGSFLSGALAVIVATPCTAPFMGAALGAALAFPPAAALAVFTALGLGMAAPYAALSCWPAGLAWLPKPGAWMERLKQALAFPLFATAAWLLWVFGRQTGRPDLGPAAAALCALGFAFWLWKIARCARSRALTAAIAAAALLALYFGRPGPELAWEPYSAQALERHLKAGREVFVDFTADWCVTCQINERFALRSRRARAALSRSGLALMKADWTSKDPEITAALERLGRRGVPAYALYAAGRPPRLLPTILTPEIVASQLSAPR